MKIQRRDLPELVRRVEKEVLDEHFKSFALLSRNQDVAILNLLCAYGDHARHYSRPNRSSVSRERRRQNINEAARGLAWCVRWLVQCAPARIWLPQRPEAEIPGEARDFLIWGFQYEDLFNRHWPAQFGFLDVTSEEASKTIRFKYAYDADPILYLRQVESRQKNTDAPMDPEVRAAFEGDFGDWVQRARFDRRSGSIQWPAILGSRAFSAAVAWLDRTLWSSVPNSLDCGGFEMGELRRFLAAVYVFCQYVSKFEDVLDGAATDMGSNVFTYSFEEWVRRFSEMLKARPDAVGAILRVFTLDVTDQHATVVFKAVYSIGDRSNLSVAAIVRRARHSRDGDGSVQLLRANS